MPCESIVAAVVRGHGHDGARAVAGQNVVADPHGHFLAREGIDGVRAREDARDAAVNHALALGAVLDGVEVGVNCGALLRSGDFVDVLALGSEHHEGDAEDRVGACGEYLQGEVVAAVDGEAHLGAFGAAYPVALRLLDGVRPVYAVEALQKALGICRHAEAPLPHLLLLHGVAAAHGETFAHLVVGQDGAQLGTPVHHRVAQIGYAVVHQHVALLLGRHGAPFGSGERQLLGARCVDTLGAVSGEVLRELLHGHGAVSLAVVVRAEHLQEGPLRPLVESGVARADGAAPVIAEADVLELADIACDVLASGYLGMLSGLDGILLGRESVGVEAHRVKDVEALQALVAREDVAGYVA